MARSEQEMHHLLHPQSNGMVWAVCHPNEQWGMQDSATAYNKDDGSTSGLTGTLPENCPRWTVLRRGCWGTITWDPTHDEWRSMLSRPKAEASELAWCGGSIREDDHTWQAHPLTRNSDTPVNYVGQAALGWDQCDMTESRSWGRIKRKLLLWKGVVNMFPWQWMNMQQHRDHGSNAFYVVCTEAIARPNGLTCPLIREGAPHTQQNCNCLMATKI